MSVDPLILSGVAVACLVVGGVATTILARLQGKSLVGRSKREAGQILSDAEREAATMLRDAKTNVKELEIGLRAEVEKEGRELRKEIAAMERRIVSKEDALDKRAESLDKTAEEVKSHERDVSKRERKLEDELERVAAIQEEQTKRLESISGMTADQARRELFTQLENEVKRDCALQLKRTEDELRENSEKKARWIIGDAIQRCAADHVAECTVSVVNLPNDDMKGRIIGREGPQYPGSGERHGHQRDHRRHAGSGDSVGIRPDPAASGADHA